MRVSRSHIKNRPEAYVLECTPFPLCIIHCTKQIMIIIKSFTTLNKRFYLHNTVDLILPYNLTYLMRFQNYGDVLPLIHWLVFQIPQTRQN